MLKTAFILQCHWADRSFLSKAFHSSSRIFQMKVSICSGWKSACPETETCKEATYSLLQQHDILKKKILNNWKGVWGVGFADLLKYTSNNSMEKKGKSQKVCFYILLAQFEKLPFALIANKEIQNLHLHNKSHLHLFHRKL